MFGRELMFKGMSKMRRRLAAVLVLMVLLLLMLGFRELFRILGFSGSYNEYPAAALTALCFVLLLDRLYTHAALVTQNLFSARGSDRNSFFKAAVRGMVRVNSLRHLLGLVMHFMTAKWGAQRSALFVRRSEESGLWLGLQRGYEKKFLDYHLDELHPLFEFFRENRTTLTRSFVQDVMAGRKILGGRLVQAKYQPFPSILDFFNDFQAECVIPSFLAHEIKTLLVVGPRKNGKPYTAEDTALLYQLAQEAATSLEGARIYDEMMHKKNELKIVNEQLEYSKGKLMKALKETESANKRLQDAQAQLIHEQKMATLGRLAASVGHEVNNPLTILSMNLSRVILKNRKDPELKVRDVFDIFHKMEQNITRIKAVVNTLTGLLKKSEKGKFEPLSLKLVLEETLPLVQFQTYLENLSGTEVEFDIPGHLPLIRGDLERLQEVFLNLFINAYHAMAGKRNRRIRVSAQIHPEDNERVILHFSDNGSGMGEEVQRKIFNYGYTTKPPGKGSGLGLYMCKYIIELHGGSIAVKSSPGAGTTFIMTLPTYVEVSSKNSLLAKMAV